MAWVSCLTSGSWAPAEPSSAGWASSSFCSAWGRNRHLLHHGLRRPSILLLTAPTPDVAGLALYVSLIVASVVAIYMARGWRALLLMAVVTGWLVLSLGVRLAARSSGNSVWVVQGGIAFYALVLWLVPLLRSGLRAQNPGRWLRPE